MPKASITAATLPNRAEQEAEDELTGGTVDREAGHRPIAGIADAAGGQRETVLQRRAEQDDAKSGQQDGADAAEHVAIEADGEADGGDEQADADEGHDDSGGQRGQAEAVAGSGGAEDQGQQRQHAGRQGGKHPGEEAEGDTASGHGVAECGLSGRIFPAAP